MCDDLTETDAARFLARAGTLDRRRFAALGAGAMTLASMPGCRAQGEPPALPVKGRDVAITTPDGITDAWFVAPTSGRHPAVLLWPDIAGLRPAYRTMAAHLAASGYAVLAVNQYYRGAKAPVLDSLVAWRTPEGQAKLKPLITQITPAGIMRDAAAYVGWLDRQGEVDTMHRIGTCGFCMGGPYTVRTAAAEPDRIGAAASFHGAGLVDTGPDSPHLLLPRTKASFLFAIAQNDDARSPDDKTTLKTAAAQAHRPAEIEVYPAQHGWCTIDAPVYDREQAEKAWSRMLVLFKANL
ncbi:dienelactone hydrolase [Novosphingobium nitrogenifigens DSM 19370]|uniref:Dienelactone hydrolase n=1 Tax=Novosphingobium nitrogenifigens DSM 19370 TaxID=983920 RepID=F1Z766_9SPHN|nr:dienelactone hydrolase family protein [Novosphingobium nitrogenifigens]EGD59572.1 dienelactone hydrolase [Novosphingobium nitrogenifigens DSM 19370]